MLKRDQVLDQWKAKVEDRSEWRQMFRQTCGKLNEERISAYEKQKEKRRKTGISGANL